MQHLPGRAAAGQTGSIGQALVCILGAAASSSSSDSADISSNAEQAAFQATQLETEPGLDLQSALENLPSKYGQSGFGHSFSRFAQERKAGEEAQAKTPRGLRADGSSKAAQQEGTGTGSQAAASTAESAAASGVNSPISLADGMADVCAEADADSAQSRAASEAPGEPDTCVLFRPLAVHDKADAAGMMTAQYGPGLQAGAAPEQLAVPEEEEISSAQKPIQEHTSTACALGAMDRSKVDMSARQAGTPAGTALQLFSPVEAVKAFSRVNSEGRSKANQVPRPSVSASSSGAAPQAVASSQSGLRQRAQRYSKVHAVHAAAQQRSHCTMSNSTQAGHIQPGQAHAQRATAEADLGHVIPLSRMTSDARAAAELAQQTRQASACSGKENDLNALSAAPNPSSLPEKSYQMAGGFSVQDNPLSAMEPSPEVPPPPVIQLSVHRPSPATPAIHVPCRTTIWHVPAKTICCHSQRTL